MQFTSGRFRSRQSHRAVGRHEDTVMLNAFNSVCDWLKCSCKNKLFKLADIQKCMSDYASTALCPDDVDCCETTYSIKHLKCKLVDCYGDYIVLLKSDGRKTLFVSEICALYCQ